jgi:hypothetical protein
METSRVINLKSNLIAVNNKMEIEKPKIDRKTLNLDRMTFVRSNPKRLDPIKYGVGGQT